VDDKRNILLAVILTAGILFGWPVISGYFFPAANPPVTKVQGGKETPLPQTQTAPAAESAQAIRDRAVVLRESPRVAIDTPKLKGSINLKGARIDDIVLPTHKETIAKDSPPVRLFSPSGTSDAYFASFAWSGEGMKLPDANSVWTADRTTLTPASPVTLRWDNGAGQRFVMKLSVDSDYMITVAQTVENAGSAGVVARPYGLLSRTGPSKDHSTWTIHTGPVGVFNGAANYSVDFKELDEEGDKRFPTTGGWLGFTDLYWHAALIPAQSLPVEAQFRSGANQRYQADMTYAPGAIAPGKSATVTSRLFVGAKETAVLERYTDQEGVALFDRAIDWGWFRWFEKPIFYLLDWLFKMIGNFGVAIICLTFIVREKVNPLAGCLPIYLQIPIFFALYKVLMLTIEMRHEPF